MLQMGCSSSERALHIQETMSFMSGESKPWHMNFRKLIDFFIFSTIIYMKKFLKSDWLREMQFLVNSMQK